MPLPTGGYISIAAIRDEFGSWGPPNMLSHYYRGALTTGNNLGVPGSGPIYLSQFHSAQRSVAGSAAWTTPGTYGFIVPVHSALHIDVRGAGGGGGGSTYDIGYGGSDGAPGGTASAAGLAGYGGAGGYGSYYNTPGKASNGSGGGGNTYNGGGGAPGGAGGAYGFTRGGDGGDGGRAASSYPAGAIAPGTYLTITVPAGGGGGAGQVSGSPGGNGAVYISWS